MKIKDIYCFISKITKPILCYKINVRYVMYVKHIHLLALDVILQLLAFEI